MQPVSPTFAAAVRTSHRLVTRVDLWYNGHLVASDLPVTAGNVLIDDDADVRTTARLTVADPWGRLLPVAGDMTRISVYGHELQIRQGLQLSPHGRVELVSVGWLRVQNIKVTERWRQTRIGTWVSAGAELEIEALDRMCRVDDYRFLSPDQPKAGATCLGEIKRITTGIVPRAAWPAMTDPAVPSNVVYDESRLGALVALATAANAKAYIDRDGNLAIRKRDVAAAATWTLSGDPDGALTDVVGEWSRDGVYNAVVARGEQTTDAAPVQGIAYETAASSPTRWGGPFGWVPAFYASPVITTPAQATAAATNRLQTYLAGRDRVVSLECVPNPAADPGRTVVTVTTPRESFTGRLVTMDLPLAPSGGPAKITIRVAPTVPTLVSGGPGAG